MDFKDVLERIWVFLKNLGTTLKKSIIWMILSYVIPIANIAILYGIYGEDFTFNLNVISILIATNACVITSLLHLFYVNEKRRELAYVVSIVTIISSVILFVLCLIQMEKNPDLMDIKVYESGAFITLLVSSVLLLISKYDEVEALSVFRAVKARKTGSTTIGDKDVDVS